MNWGSPEFVIALVAITTAGWIINNWIRARHGYSLEDEWGGKSMPAPSTEERALEAKNRELIDQMENMQDRMIVLERIVTDKGYRLSDEIDALADRRETPS